MKNLRVTFYGTSPLLMHSPKGVNPLHPLAIEKKKYTSKHKKTDEDNLIISDLDWELGVYWDDTIGLYVPKEALDAVLCAGAKFNRKGTDVQRFCHVSVPMSSLDISEPQDYEALKNNNRFRDVRPVVIDKKRVICTRPRFNTWSTQFEMFYEHDKIDLSTIAMAFENAGKYVGLLDGRKLGYGRFTVTIEELD